MRATTTTKKEEEQKRRRWNACSVPNSLFLFSLILRGEKEHNVAYVASELKLESEGEQGEQKTRFEEGGDGWSRHSTFSSSHLSSLFSSC